MAADLGEALMDAVALPGKLAEEYTGTEDTMDAIQASLVELVHLNQ